MGKIVNDFFNNLESGASWSAGVAFNRSNPLPLDKYSVFNGKEEAMNYVLNNPIAYPGQVIVVIEEDNAELCLIVEKENEIVNGEEQTYSLTLQNLEIKIDTNGGITNINPATIKGYNCGGYVKAFNPQNIELIVCEVNHENGEFISEGEIITATYMVVDGNYAAGVYNYKGVDYPLNNVTSSEEVANTLGFSENERVCLKVFLKDVSELSVGMTYNLCYPANTKQRYGKIIEILESENSIIIDGECNGIHRNYIVNNVVFPITSTSYNGNFVIDGGLIGDFEITDSEGVSLHSEGIETYASVGGHSEGYKSKALGFSSHAEGEGSIASGYGAHAEGAATEAKGHQSHTEGERTEAKGYASHAEGQQAVAEGSTSHAEGNMTLASGRVAHAEGNNTKATNNYAHSEGHYTEAAGMASHAEGSSTKVISTYGHVEGSNNIVGQEVETGDVEYTFTITPSAGGNMGVVLMGNYTDSKGNVIDFDCIIDKGNNSGTVILTDVSDEVYIGRIYDWESGIDDVTSQYQVAETEKKLTNVHGVSAHAEGQDTKALEDFSHAEGRGTQATGIASHAEGQGTKATEKQAHAEGYNTEAFGDRAHAEGNSTKAHGSMSHAEGYSTEATGQYTHSEGWLSKATGQVGHAEGYKTEAKGRFSHAEGRETLASGTAAHATGLGTIASGANQVVSGKYNKPHSTHLRIVGKGTSDTDRDNAYVLDKDGNGYFAGNVFVGDANNPANAKELATKEYVDSKKVDLVQSDWNQNDTTQDDYIKNRPFYKEENVPIDYFDIVLDYEINDGEMWMVLENAIGLLPNVTYTMDALDIDGNIISTAQILMNDAGDGVVYTTNTINGVYIYDYSDDCWNYSDNSALIEWGYDEGTIAHTIRIHGVPSIGTLYHKISQEYLNLDGLIPIPDWRVNNPNSPGYIKNKPTLVTLTQVDEKINEKLAELVDSAPETLNTLNELAKALGDDPNFAATVAAQIGSKLSINAGYDNEGKYLKVVNGNATWVNIPNAEEVSF